MTCYDYNDAGHLYQACPFRWRSQETAPVSTLTFWADIAARGRERTQTNEDAEEISRFSEQPEVAVRGYEEHCASHPLEDGRSGQCDEHVQVDVTLKPCRFRHNQPWRQLQTWWSEW